MDSSPEVFRDVGIDLKGHVWASLVMVQESREALRLCQGIVKQEASG